MQNVPLRTASVLLFVSFLILLVPLFYFFLLPRLSNEGYEAPEQGKLNIVTTTYPLYDFTKNVGGDVVSVTNATPSGVEPHDFEPTAKQVAFMEDADIFIMNGAGLDAWAEDIAVNVKANGGRVLTMSEAIDMKAEDPHIWLDPVRAEEMVREIEKVLIAADKENADSYGANSSAYQAKLSELDSAYRIDLSSCSLHDIIVAHDAFSYLGERYTINVHHILGVSPDEEPSAKDLSHLVDAAKNLGIKTIFFETLLSPKLSETIANDIGGKTAVLNPVEGLTEAQEEKGDDYLSLMRENKRELQKALLCQ
jgi:zinc transport system substrate-binding protein